MAYVPAESPFGDPSSARGAGSGAVAPTPFGPTHNPASAAHHRSLSEITRLIRGIDSEETREQSLDLLCKNRQACDDLAILLWNSFGTMKLLLQEITSVYRPLLSNSLSERAVTQVCNAIALLQSVASHPETRMQFVKGNFIFNPPNMLTMQKWLITFFLLKYFLVAYAAWRLAEYCQKQILLNEKGLKYCFILADRYLSVSHALAKMVERLAEEDEENSPRLLRNIIGCYLRLSENQRTRQRLSTYIPSKLVDNTYTDILRDDPEALSNLQQLICNLKTSQRSRTQSTGESLGLFIR